MESSREPRSGEAGYVLVMSALLLVPLLAFAAFTVDVGAWTVQTTKAQNAADAAALAGASYLPDHGKAFAAARDLAAKNGFVDGMDGVTVDTEIGPQGGVRVTINQPSNTYFSGVVLDDKIQLSRASEATALAPVGMGSPSNILGFGPYSIDGSDISGYWLVEGNECTRAHFGDVRAARFLDPEYCTGASIPNPHWKRSSETRDEGYFYVVTIPPGLDVSSQLMIMDPGRCPAYAQKGNDDNFRGLRSEGVTLGFRMWDTGGTALSSHDDTPATDWWESDECLSDLPYPSTEWVDYSQGWTASPFIFPPNTTGEPETYLIQTRVARATVHGWNRYAFWVKPQNGVTSCTTIGSDACPTISAEDFVSVSVKGPGVGLPMDLYLANIGPEHQGRDLEITVWDPGEGMQSLQVLDPNGKPLNFTWSSDDPKYGQDNTIETCNGDPCLLLYPELKRWAPKIPGWPKSWKLNGRMVTFTVPLDSQVDYSQYTDHWFQLRYNPIPTKIAGEAASFAISLGGDPVRLVD